MCACFVAALGSSAFGADATQPAGDFQKGDFQKGTWALSFTGAYAHSFTESEAKIETGSVGVGYYLFDHVALNLEAAGFSVQQPGPDSAISELDLLIRHHVWVVNRFSLFLDAGGGVSYATAPTPGYGTYYNYLAEAGIGATWRIKDNVHVMGGVRWLHFSNAALKGPEHNPSINATEGYVGLIFTF